MTLRSSKIQKVVSSIIIASLFASLFIGFTAPQKASAATVVLGVPTNDALAIKALGAISVSTTRQEGYAWKAVLKEVARQAMMVTVRKLLTRMTQNTVNWINSGFHGNPLYIENPKSFFADIAKTEVKSIINMFGYDSAKFPFGKDFALNIANSYKRQLEENAAYSLSKVTNDPIELYNYQHNFNFGGWDGFLTNTQYPQNNYIGFNMVATENLARKLRGAAQTNIEKVQSTLDRSMGFLSPQVCTGPNKDKYNNLKNEFQRPTFQPTVPYNPPVGKCANTDYATYNTKESCQANGWTWTGSIVFGSSAADQVIANNQLIAYENEYNKKVEEERAKWAETNVCQGGLVSTTPGSVVASHLMGAINSKFAQAELGAALGNSLSTIFDALLLKFMKDGLNKLSRSGEPEDDWTPAVVSDGEGACIAEISVQSPGLRAEVQAAIDSALEKDPALAELYATKENVQKFRDLVVEELKAVELDASASYNGNCNLSPNNLGVREPGAATGHLYDVVREDEEHTIKEAAGPTWGRPQYNGDALWEFITGGVRSVSVTQTGTSVTGGTNIIGTSGTGTGPGGTTDSSAQNDEVMGPELFGVQAYNPRRPEATGQPTPASPPTDSTQKYPSRLSLVQQAKAAVVAANYNNAPADPRGDCKRLEIVKKTVELLKAPIAVEGGTISYPAGFVDKYDGVWQNNCNYNYTNMIAFPDGYVVQILGANDTPIWRPVACFDPLHPYWLNILRWGGRSDYPSSQWANVSPFACPTLYKFQWDQIRGGDNGGGSSSGPYDEGESGNDPWLF